MPALNLSGVAKRYRETLVLDDISFSFPRGTCLALVGSNGAGKSTLINIVSGVTRPTRGHFSVLGRHADFRTPRDARRAGVSLIPQELAYVPELTVAENLMIGRWPAKYGIISMGDMRRRAGEIIRLLDLPIDVRKDMLDLTLAERQLVEIAKALATNAGLLILDEPTASLGSADSGRLLEILVRLKSTGTSMIYVSHNLDECFSIGDSVNVLRNGRMVMSASTGETNPDEVVRAMLGGILPKTMSVRANHQSSGHPPTIRVRNLTKHTQPNLSDVNFEASTGEILVIFGLLGSGVEAIAQSLVGDNRRVAGSLEINGDSRSFFRSPREALGAGVCYVPAERKTQGLALCRSVSENLVVQLMPELAAHGVVNRRRERQRAIDLVKSLDIKCRDSLQEVGELSGGNQQKVLLGSRLAHEPKVLVLHEPTRGVDIGARFELYDMFANEADRGGTIIILTSDVTEAVTISTRLMVIWNGCLVSELIGSDITEASALAAASGVGALKREGNE